MQPLLSPGDALELDLDPARRAGAGPGDIVVFLDAGVRLTAHRVLACWRGNLLTKGDARLLPDPPLPASAVVAVAVAVLNYGRRRPLDSRAAGLAAAAAGALLVVCRRLAQLTAWPARGILLAVWSASEYALHVPLWSAAPAAARVLAAAMSRAEIAPEALIIRLSASLRWIWERPGTEEPTPALGGRSAGGLLAADEIWSGNVRLFGDVVVPQGVTLTVAAGSRVVAEAPKRWHHGVSRRAQGAPRQADPRRSRLAVYGRLIVEGQPEAPATFSGDWEGIALYGGVLEARNAKLTGAVCAVSARDGAQALLRDCDFENCATAVEGGGGSTIELVDSRISNCASGLAADGGTSLLRGVSLSASRRAGALLSAGEHLLEDCSFSDGPSGLEASGSASAKLTRASFADASGPAVALAGKAVVIATDVRVARCGAGFELAEDARLEGAGFVVEDVSGHGLCLQDRGRAEVKAAKLARCGDNGVYVQGEAALELIDSGILNCASGLAADGGTSLLRGVSLSASRRAGALLSAGEHLLEDCSFSDGPSGLEASGSASAKLTRASFADASGPAVALAGKAVVIATDVRVARCGAGFELAEDARLEGAGFVVEDVSGHGLCLQDRGRAEVKAAKLARCGDNGVYVQGEAALELIDSGILNCASGLAADGGTSLLRGVSLSASRRAGALLSAGEHLLEDCSFSDGPSGLEASGSASAKLTRASFADASGPAVALAGKAVVIATDVRVARCGAGFELAEDARLEGAGFVVEDVSGHGLCLQDRGRAEVKAAKLARCGDNGVYVQGEAALELIDSGILNCASGLAADGGTSLLRGVSLSASRRAGALLSAGEHLLEDCSFSDGPSGLEASGSASAKLTRASFADASGPAVALAGKAVVIATDVRVARCGAGFELAEDARLEGAGFVVEDVSGHGLCLQDRGRAEVKAAKLARCGDNGVYVQGEAALELIDSGILNCASGLAADGGTSLLRGVHLVGNRRLNADMAAGRHVFEDCVSERAPRGLSVRATAVMSLAGVRLEGHELAVCVAGEARLAARRCRWRGNGVGLWVQEAGHANLEDGRFVGQAGQALRLGQQAGANMTRCLFLGDSMAVLAEDDSSLEALRCLFRLTPTGVKLDGRSRARLTDCRFSVCALDGLWMAAEAWTRAKDCVFLRCRVGLHAHISARPEWPGSSFRLSGAADQRTFS